MDLSVYKQSSSSPNLPWIPCKEASHGGRTVRATVSRDRRGGQASPPPPARAVQRRHHPAGRSVGGPARPADLLGVPATALAAAVALAGAALAQDDERPPADGGRAT